MVVPQTPPTNQTSQYPRGWKPLGVVERVRSTPGPTPSTETVSVASKLTTGPVGTEIGQALVEREVTAATEWAPSLFLGAQAPEQEVRVEPERPRPGAGASR